MLKIAEIRCCPGLLHGHKMTAFFKALKAGVGDLCLESPDGRIQEGVRVCTIKYQDGLLQSGHITPDIVGTNRKTFQ